MHNFVVHSNESACRIIERLGLDQVHCFTIYVVVPASPLLGSLPFSCTIPYFYVGIPALYSKISCYLVF